MNIRIDRSKQFDEIQNQTIIISNDIIYIKSFIKDEHLLIPLQANVSENDFIRHENKSEFIKLLKEFFGDKSFEMFKDNYKIDILKNYDVSDDLDNLEVGDFIYMSFIKEWFYISKINDMYVLISLEDNYNFVHHSTMTELKAEIKKSVRTLEIKHYAKNNIEVVLNIF